jgi:hypothetical protein
MTRAEVWKGVTLRLIVFPEDAPQDEREAALGEILSDARIGAEIVFAPSGDAAAVIEISLRSALVFLPFRFHGNLIRLPVEGPMEELLQKLPTAVMILAAEDIDLGAEPEEGTAAALAEARDLKEKRERQAKESEEEADAAGKAAETIAAKLQQAMARPEQDRDAERIAALISERDKALAAAEKARRKAAKAHAKAEQAQEVLENEQD